MISIIIERSGPQMVVLGVYPGYTSEKTRETANNMEADNPGIDVDVLEFQGTLELNRFLREESNLPC